jgi:predicted flap endonuclease-1-like 5' DNA nuclease
MATSISRTKGMTVELNSKLAALKITNTDHILNAAGKPEGRKELAKSLGIQPSALLEFLNRADLARVKGIGEVYSNLLENAGVDTVKELAHRVPANLHAKLVEINAEKKLTQRDPTLDMVTSWVTQAKALPPVLEY